VCIFSKLWTETPCGKFCSLFLPTVTFAFSAVHFDLLPGASPKQTPVGTHPWGVRANPAPPGGGGFRVIQKLGPKKKSQAMFKIFRSDLPTHLPTHPPPRSSPALERSLPGKRLRASLSPFHPYLSGDCRLCLLIAPHGFLQLGLRLFPWSPPQGIRWCGQYPCLGRAPRTANPFLDDSPE